jgi:hypothetical protein
LGLARIVHRQDVGVMETRGSADLAQEALRAERGGELGVKHLERHRAVVPEVMGQVDSGHATAAELALKRVSVAQNLGQGRLDASHEHCRRWAVPAAICGGVRQRATTGVLP